jgi:secretion/DNA translocation related CpaE-like protein
VLLGADCAEDVVALRLTRRAGVSLVSAAPEDPQLWRQAVAVGADHVYVLPDAESELAGRLTEVADGAPWSAVTVGVIGARGGAGASTFACALALTAARQGDTALLVDVDPLGGGIELVLGCESAPGLRWPDVAATHGRVSAGALRSALPSVEGLAVLSWQHAGTGELAPDILATVLAAGRRGCELVVLDLPRHVDDRLAEAVAAVDIVLLVCTAQVRAIASAKRLLQTLETHCGDIRLVMRRLGRIDLQGPSVASALELPLAITVPTRRAIERSIEDGLGPPGRGGLSRSCRSLLDELGAHRRVAA